MVFQEVENESQTVLHALNHLDLRVELFNDPRAFLLNIRTYEPALCLIDCTTPKTDFSLAIIRTMRSMLDHNIPILALVRAGDQPMIDRAKAAGAEIIVDKPISTTELARQLSSYVTTDAIAKLLKLGPEATAPNVLALPKVVDWFFEQLAPVLIELQGYFEVFDDNERQLKYYALKAQRYDAELIELVKVVRRSEEKLNLIQSMRLYGATNVRNLITALALTDLTRMRVFTFNPKTALPTEDVRKIITYGIRAVEHFGEGSRYQQVAFACGVVFDLFALHAQFLEDRKRPLLKMIETAFTECMKRSDRGFIQGKEIPDLTLEKHVISTLMMREAGKIALALFFPEYLDIRADFDKRGIRPVLQQAVEEQDFAISYNLFGALICQVSPSLAPARQAVLFCDYPFMLENFEDGRDSLTLAKLCQSL